MPSRFADRRVRHAVLVLSVLAGLLGMHGLSGGHSSSASHAAMSMPDGSGAARSAVPPSRPLLAVGSTTANASSQAGTTSPAPAVVAAGPLADVGHGMSGTLIACLAVLPGGLLLRLMRRGRAHRPMSRPDRPAGPRGGPVAGPRYLPPEPDLVAGLCVSRT